MSLVSLVSLAASPVLPVDVLPIDMLPADVLPASLVDVVSVSPVDAWPVSADVELVYPSVLTPVWPVEVECGDPLLELWLLSVEPMGSSGTHPASGSNRANSEGTRERFMDAESSCLGSRP